MTVSNPLLSATALNKTYRSKAGLHVALRDISFEMAAGTSVAIVGESGSGKTTAAMCVARLTRLDSGAVLVDGEDFLAADAVTEKRIRRSFGIVLQNPLTSLDPRVRVGRSVAEPLVVQERSLGSREIEARALAALERVGLDAAQARSFPHELSGGQLQRAVIARALILQPRWLILDEPTSALDVSIQAQVLNLLCDLRDVRGLSYLFITHNLALVQILASEVLVMFAGAVVERGAAHRVFESPRHPYTAELLSSVPDADIRMSVEPPAAGAMGVHVGTAGCAFAPRCAHAQPLCIATPPPVATATHPVSCYFPLEGQRP